MRAEERAGVWTGVGAGVAGAARAFDWRAHFSAALAREVEERRLFLWIPVAAMGGVCLNLAADREPVLWLPIGLGLVFAALAWISRRRRFAFSLLVAAAALFSGFAAMGLRTAR